MTFATRSAPALRAVAASALALAVSCLAVPAAWAAGVNFTPSGGALASQVADVLRAEPAIDGAGDVRVIAEGKAIKLMGWTATLSGREQAATRTEAVPGVSMVHVQLDVRPRHGMGSDPGGVVTAALRTVAGAEGVSATTMAGGRVILSGTVARTLIREDAVRAVKAVEGVRSLDINVLVKPQPGSVVPAPQTLPPAGPLVIQSVEHSSDGTHVLLNGVRYRVLGSTPVSGHGQTVAPLRVKVGDDARYLLLERAGD